MALADDGVIQHDDAADGAAAGACLALPRQGDGAVHEIAVPVPAWRGNRRNHATGNHAADTRYSADLNSAREPFVETPARTARRLLALAILLLPGLAAAQQTVTIQKPWLRYLLPNIPAAAYMTLLNAGSAPVTLTGASSPACGMLMLHKSEDDSGMAMMMDVPNITIPPHGSQTLAPGGYHLMCMQPRMKIGDTVPLTLNFQNGPSVSAALPVYGAQGAP
jgi:copper(I)-binding protein